MPTADKKTFKEWCEQVPDKYELKVLHTTYKGTGEIEGETFIEILRDKSRVTCKPAFWSDSWFS